ncbi:MAG: hypothetical protein J3K34DRAFT_414845 [Monoraphidium minutum]|nr:MAG: hypothetical protein J3K34DRAFT_414845 [Monoraphidium minutum]
MGPACGAAGCGARAGCGAAPSAVPPLAAATSASASAPASGSGCGATCCWRPRRGCLRCRADACFARLWLRRALLRRCAFSSSRTRTDVPSLRTTVGAPLAGAGAAVSRGAAWRPDSSWLYWENRPGFRAGRLPSSEQPPATSAIAPPHAPVVGRLNALQPCSERVAGLCPLAERKFEAPRCQIGTLAILYNSPRSGF